MFYYIIIYLLENWVKFQTKIFLAVPFQFEKVRIILNLNFYFSGIVSLSLNTIDVPAHRVVGDKAELICQFDMEGDTLYSVKWYKDDREFYRFVPNDRPRLQVFDTEGIHVDVSNNIFFSWFFFWQMNAIFFEMM